MKKEFFPDGTEIDSWFYQTDGPKFDTLGKPYKITDFGIKADGEIYTEKFQKLIDEISSNGGGVMVVPEGTFMTGAIFLKQGVNLYLEKGGTIKGSDDIADYPVMDTRIEGLNCKYYPALINVSGVDGLVIAGEGTIDGNGWKSWKAFWQRRSWNPNCTNKDEQRARLIFIEKSSNILISGITIQNSMFWTTHLYKCDHVKYLNCKIFSPGQPYNAPSTDAIDIDATCDVLIKNCDISVNDDSVCMKGGKGPWADKDPNNGTTERVLVEDCTFGFTHSCITCGSECIHANNIIVRRCKAGKAYNFFRLKMRPDTPQIYENILVEDCESEAGNFVNVNPWRQFYDLEDRKDIPLSYGRNITFRNCFGTSEKTVDIFEDKSQYELTDISFENMKFTEIPSYWD